VPVQAGGLLLDEAAAQSGAYDEFEPSVSGVNKDLKSAGHATSGVFGIYDLKQVSGDKAAPAVIFSGYDGTFNPQAVIRQDESEVTGGKITAVAPGPHGGSAMCASSGTGAGAAGICAWATGTTYAVLAEKGTGSQAVSGMPGLLVKMRPDLEVAPGAAPGPEPGQLLVRASGSAEGNSGSFIASTEKLKVTYAFKCGPAALDYGNFEASLTADQAVSGSYSLPFANLVGAGKTGTAIIDAPIGGLRYHVSVISEPGCTWSVVVRTD
jgi:hypothetical protein